MVGLRYVVDYGYCFCSVKIIYSKNQTNKSNFCHRPERYSNLNMDDQWRQQPYHWKPFSIIILMSLPQLSTWDFQYLWQKLHTTNVMVWVKLLMCWSLVVYSIIRPSTENRLAKTKIVITLVAAEVFHYIEQLVLETVILASVNSLRSELLKTHKTQWVSRN